MLCLFASRHGNLFYTLTPDLISCLIDRTERGTFVSPWRKRRVNQGFKNRGKCCWKGRSRFIKTETNALSRLYSKSDLCFFHLKMSISLRITHDPLTGAVASMICVQYFLLLTGKETGKCVVYVTSYTFPSPKKYRPQSISGKKQILNIVASLVLGLVLIYKL